MRKWYTLAVAGVIAATLADVASAQLSLWFDRRSTIAAINTPVIPYTNGTSSSIPNANGGGRGDAQVQWVSPTMTPPNGIPGQTNPAHLFQGHDASQASLYLYGDFTGNTGEVLSSLGLDISIASPAAGAMSLASVTFEAYNAQADVGVITSANAWDGTNAASLTPTTAGFTNFRAVRVPVAAGPVFDPNLGIKPGQGYRLARLGFQGAGPRNNPAQPPFPPAQAVSTLGIKMTVGELLITRVSQTGAEPLPVNFGYLNGQPEAANGNGSTQGATSATNDATIVVIQKGDYNASGGVNNQDIQPFVNARAKWLQPVGNTATQLETWLGDFNGVSGINNQDIQGFVNVRSLF